MAKDFGKRPKSYGYRKAEPPPPAKITAGTIEPMAAREFGLTMERFAYWLEQQGIETVENINIYVTGRDAEGKIVAPPVPPDKDGKAATKHELNRYVFVDPVLKI